MQSKKNTIKRIIASLLCVVLVMGVMPSFGDGFESEAAEETEYTELTFSDWGFADGLLEADAKSATQCPVTTTLDKTAFTGIVNFSGTSSMIRLGGGSNEWCGLHISYLSQPSGLNFALINSEGNQYLTGGATITEEETGMQLYNADVKMRLTFDVVGTTVKIGIYLNDKYIRTLEFENGEKHLGYKLLIQGSSQVSIQSVRSDMDLTFSDLNVEEKTYTGERADAILPEGISSLNGVCVKGKVNFPSTSPNSYIQFGHTTTDRIDQDRSIRMFISDGTLWFWEQNGKGNHQNITPEEGDSFQNTWISFSMSFRSIGANIVVQATVITKQNTYTKEWKMEDWASTMGNCIVVNSHPQDKAPITVASWTGEYKTIGFAQYQMKPQEFSGTGAEKYVPYGAVPTLSKIAFEDDVTFEGSSAFVYLASKNAWNGIQIRQDSNDLQLLNTIDTSKYLKIANEDAKLAPGTSLRLRVEFQIVHGTDLLLRAYTNGVYGGTCLWKGVASSWGTGLYLYTGENQKLTIGKLASDISAYDRLTPLEFGMEDYTVYFKDASTGKNHYAQAYVGDSVHGTYLDANVTFGSENTADDSVRFASPDGWRGLQLSMYQDGDITKLRLMHAEDGQQQYCFDAETLGISYAESFNMKCAIRFSDYNATAHTQSIAVVMFVNDVLVQEVPLTFTGVPTNSEGKANYLSIYAPKGVVSIATPYETVTLYDLGIADKRYIAETAIGTYAGNTMDGVALSTTVTFAEQSAAGKNHFKIGGRFLVGYDYNEGSNPRILMWDLDGSCHGVFTIGENGLGDVAGKSTKMKFTFDYVNMAKDVRVGLYVNGVNCGFNIFTDAAATFTKNVSVISNDKPILIGGSYTEWTLWDWSVEDGSIQKAADTKVCQNTMISSFDKSIFSAKMQFANDGSGNNSLRIGGWEGKEWYGIQIFCAANQLYAQDLFNSPTNSIVYSFDHDISSTPFELTLQFDYVKTDIRVTFYVDGVYRKTITYAGAASKIGSYLVLQTTDEEALGFASVGTRKEEERLAVAYDLAEGNYLITGNAVSVNGVAKQAGEEISTPGDYEIKRLENHIVYTQEVALYQVGDVNCDGQIAKTEDLQVLNTLLEKKNGKKVSTASEYAADLDRNGYLNIQDLTLMKNVFNAAITMDAVNTKYDSNAQTFEILGGSDVMPIAGYRGPYRRNDYDGITNTMFAALKKSGLNMFNFSHNSWGEDDQCTIEALKLAEEYQMGCFVDDFAFRHDQSSVTVDATNQTAVAQRLSNYSYFDSFIGTHLWDEPTKEVLSKYKNIANTLNKYSNTLGFLNLYPSDYSALNWDYTKRSDEDAFRAYCDDFFTAKQHVLSVDDYPFNDKVSEGTENASGYFTSLAITREKALANQVPFWWYVQSGGCQKSNRNDDLVASYEERFWNVNTGLAFGAKGIEWFTAIEVSENAKDDNGKSLSAIVNQDGSATANTTGITEANAQIKAVDGVLMKSTSKAIIASGVAKTQINKGVSGTAVDKYGKVTGVASTSSQGALVGYFDYRNTQSLYVVNYDVTANASATITLTMDGNYSYKAIDRDGNKTGKTERNKITLTIRSGEAVLIVLDDVNATGTASEAANLIRYKRVEKGLADFSAYYDGDANGDYIFDSKDVDTYRKRLVVGYYES